MALECDPVGSWNAVLGSHHLTRWNVKNPCLPGLRLVADVNRASAAASLGLSLTALPVLLSCGVYLVLTVEFCSVDTPPLASRWRSEPTCRCCTGGTALPLSG